MDDDNIELARLAFEAARKELQRGLRLLIAEADGDHTSPHFQSSILVGIQATAEVAERVASLVMGANQLWEGRERERRTNDARS